MKLQSLFQGLRQAWCDHVFDSRAIRRITPGQVQSQCMKCDKVCNAPYGIALPGKLR
jgi:hypothetical protein